MPATVFIGVDADELKFREAGAFACLPKPFKMEEVDEAVEGALRKR